VAVIIAWKTVCVDAGLARKKIVSSVSSLDAEVVTFVLIRMSLMMK